MSMYDSEPISQLPLAISVSANDAFAMVDVLDRTESSSGTTKKVTMSTLASYIFNNIPWSTVAVGPVSLLPNRGYIMNGTDLILATLPLTARVGDQFLIEGNGAGLFQIMQNAGQSIVFDSYTTTVGTGGYIESTTTGDGVAFMCIEENTKFKVRNFIGTFITI